MFTYLWLACRFLQSAVRSRCDVALENLALRQQLVVLTRSSRRPRLSSGLVSETVGPMEASG